MSYRISGTQYYDRYNVIYIVHNPYTFPVHPFDWVVLGIATKEAFLSAVGHVR
jgi:hypothetical protein